MDEPLYVIYQADSIISISGQNILSNFKTFLLPKKLNENDSQTFLTTSDSNTSICLDDSSEDFSEENLLSKTKKKKI